MNQYGRKYNVGQIVRLRDKEVLKRLLKDSYDEKLNTILDYSEPEFLIDFAETVVKDGCQKGEYALRIFHRNAIGVSEDLIEGVEFEPKISFLFNRKQNKSTVTDIDSDYCSFETAKLLKNKNYIDNNADKIIYDRIGNKFYVNSLLPYSYVDIPNQDNERPKENYPCDHLFNIQRWLRENHGIHVAVDYNKDGWYYILYDIPDGTRLASSEVKDILYEGALENGIVESLNFI